MNSRLKRPAPPTQTPTTLVDLVALILARGITLTIHVHHHDDPASAQRAIDRLTRRAKASNTTLADAVHASTPSPDS